MLSYSCFAPPSGREKLASQSAVRTTTSYGRALLYYCLGEESNDDPFPSLPLACAFLFVVFVKIPKNNLYWNLVKLVCPQISSFHSGVASASGSREYTYNSPPTPAKTGPAPTSTAPVEGGGGGVESLGSPAPGLETFRSIPRFSRREPMSVFMPPERAKELRLSKTFLSFLRGCLRYETEERMTAQDMLSHPFLQVC